MKQSDRSAAASENQVDKFRSLARELEADEDADHFEETVRKIAPKGPILPENDFGARRGEQNLPGGRKNRDD